MTRILPSLLAADTGHLADEALRAQTAGADELHLDIMDGHFVPNISFGPEVVRMAKKLLTVPLNVHLMLSRPDRYLERFVSAGAHTVQIHVEASCDVPAALAEIRRLGAVPAVVINPETPVEALEPVLPLADEVLCMTVHPGYGGQSFMPEVLPKVAAVAGRLRALGRPGVPVMVDGGISLQTVSAAAAAGATAFVAGSALFRAADMASDIRAMRDLARAAAPRVPDASR